MYKPCYKTIHFQRILFLEVGCLEQGAVPSKTAHRKAKKQLTELVAKQAQMSFKSKSIDDDGWRAEFTPLLLLFFEVSLL